MWIVWLEKKILKTLGILLGIIIVLLTALHVYVVNNAEKLIEDLVETRSDNKLKLKVKNIKFNYFSRKIELQQVAFYSNDSLDMKTSYHFSVDNIRLKVKALIPIFTRKELLIDSLYLSAPKIEVTRLKSSDLSVKKEVSIPEEMGRIYNSIIDALKMLQVTRFELNEGQFTLINKIHPDQQPLVITNLHFHIDNFRIDTSNQSNKFLFSDQMVFRTRNQDIIFPDGNHRLAFGRFRINIRKQLIEIDSCTLSGRRSDSSRSAFSVFFDTLMLANVDFKALYEKELIKADSVYCLNPKFKIHLEPKNKNAPKGQLPNLDTLIQQLTGDLQLGYIGVKNAAVDITTYQNGKPSSFTSDNNNFEMTGLSINHSLPQPVSLQGFDMAIHNYENFLKDSSYFLRFDSILLRENKILLSNFSVNTEPFIDSRNISVQQFELAGLSWSDLLFDRKVKALQATLYSPVIDYTEPVNKKQKKGRNITSSLDIINNLMELEKLRIVNGEIKIKTQKITDLILQNANLVINSRQAVQSADAGNIKQSIESLSFSKGTLRLNNLVVKMGRTEYNDESNRFFFEKINIYDQQQTANVTAKKIILDNLQLDADATTISAGSVNWQQATVEINAIGNEKKENKSPLTVLLKNINGNNTQLNINSVGGFYSAYITTLLAAKINKQEKLTIEALKATGKNFSSNNNTSELTADDFAIADNGPSVINSLHFIRHKDSNTVEITIPKLSLVPDINSIIDNRPDLKKVNLEQPEIVIKTKNKIKQPGKEKKLLPEISVDRIEIDQPVINVQNNVGEGLQQFSWQGNDTRMILQNIRTGDRQNNEIKIGSLESNFSNFSFTGSKGKTTSSRQGRLEVQAEDILLQTGDSFYWQALVKRLTAKNFTADSVGKKHVAWKLNTAEVKNLSLSSAYISSSSAFIEKNPAFIISDVSGYMIDEKNSLSWKNFSYTRNTQSASLDSFSFRPVLSREAFIAATPWQTDYMTLNTGSITITKIDLDGYLKDSVIRIGDFNINNPYFTSYRDKRPPFHAGIIKPLPPHLLMKIPRKFSIDTLRIANGTAVYTELNDKTKETGTLPVTRMSGDIFPIKNYGITSTDSLRIRINGYLMDSAWIRLRVRESYLDSLAGFLITIRMRPRSLIYLNKVLEPLASVKLQSGYLDTLIMRAVGTEYLSLGEMRMYYHDLKVQFLRNGSESKKRFLTGLMTFIANSFVIKNENSKKSGVVYFPRLRDRSFINYYIKIAMSGIASSIGAKKNKKLLRRYQRQLKIRQLPPIDFD